jgi:hypothetical protein
MNEAEESRPCAKCGCSNGIRALACWNCRTPQVHYSQGAEADAGLPGLLTRYAGQAVLVNASNPNQHEPALLTGVSSDHFSIKPLAGDTVHHLPYRCLAAAREVMVQPDGGQPAVQQLHLDITRPYPTEASQPA